MNEDMNIPETVRFLLNQQAQFYSDMQAMREQSAAEMQEIRDTVAAVAKQQLDLAQTVNAIAAAFLRAEQANAEAHRRMEENHRRLEESQQRAADAHAVLELKSAETEEKLNALIDIVSRYYPPKDHSGPPPASEAKPDNPPPEA
jgi:uncharacterized NAD(P)/FAD-binding protein YdhS